MFSSFKYVYETLTLNRDYIESIEDTLELLVSDLMITLGYDRRRNKQIKKLRNSKAHWSVTLLNGEKFIVKVVKLGESVENIDTDDIDEYTDDCFCLVVTDGEYMALYNKKLGTEPIVNFNLYSDEPEVMVLLNTIKDGDKFYKYIQDKIKQSEEPAIIEAIRNAGEEILSEEFINGLNLTNVSRDRIFKIFSKLINQPKVETSDNNKPTETLDDENKNLTENNETSNENSETSENSELLEAEIQEYKLKIENLETELQNTKNELEKTQGLLEDITTKTSETSEIDETTETIQTAELAEITQAFEDEKSALNKEIETLKSEIDELKNIVDTKDEEIKKLTENQNELDFGTENSDETNSLIAENNSLKENIENLKAEHLEEITNLNNEIDNLTKQIENQSKQENEAADLKTKIDELTDINENLKAALNSQEETVDRLKAENTNLKETISKLNSENSSNNDASKNSYINQIESLTVRVSELEDTIASKDSEIDNLQKKLLEQSNPKEDEARKLLDTVIENDDENEPVSFVGVVEGNLYQANTIEKFIGLSLQELYDVVSFDLMAYVFDGDVFKITDKVVRTDFILGTKAYDLDIEGLSENECIRRLKTLFSKFPSVVFLYKKIGKIGIRQPDEIITYDNQGYNAPIFSSEDIGALQNFGDNSTENLSDTVDSNFGGNLESNSNYPDWVHLAIAISDLQMILWNDTLDIGNIKYIADLNRVYMVDNSNLGSTFESIVNAVIGMSGTLTDSIEALQNAKFDVTSNTEDGLDIEIPFNGEHIKASSLRDLDKILLEICNLCKVDASNTFLYFEANIDEESELAGNLVETNGWDHDGPSDFVDPDEEETVHCIISGSWINMVPYTKAQEEIQRKALKKCLAIKTKYITAPIKDGESIANIITEILANSDIPTEELISQIGNVPGENYKIISRNKNEVSYETYSTQINGDDYYISTMEEWQTLYSLIRLHLIAKGDYLIGVRAIISKSLLDIYSDPSFYCIDPVKDVAIRTFTDYTITRLK